MAYEPLEDKRVYRRAEVVADAVWQIVAGWETFAKRTVGEQLVRAADSIGANVAEAFGRFNPGEVRTFLYYARGSLTETRYWLRRACHRGLLTPDSLAALDADLSELAREINAAVKHQRSRRIPPKS